MLDTAIELAGMMLDRPFEPGDVFIPSEIRLEGDRLLWTMRKPDFKRPPGSILEKFRRLYTEPDAAIFQFAKHFGVAWFCQHRLPGSHAQVPFAAQFGMKACFPVKLDGVWFEERPADYRRYSAAADSIIQAAATVNVGDIPDDAVFEDFAYSQRPLTVDPFAVPQRLIKQYVSKGLGWTGPATDLPHIPKQVLVDSARARVAEEVNLWIAVAQAHPRIDWQSDRKTWRPSFRHSPWGLLGSVALALLTTVPISKGWLLCAICGDSYQPERPATQGRNHYCKACRGGSEMWRLLKRQQRAQEVSNAKKTRKR